MPLDKIKMGRRPKTRQRQDNDEPKPKTRQRIDLRPRMTQGWA